MSRSYIVLRKQPELERTGDLLGGGPRAGLRGPIVAPSIEFERMDARDAHDLARAPGVEAVVPEIPLKLVRPLAMPEQEAAAAASQLPWGLQAVGALDTPFTGKGIKVAILDTGIDRNHKAFEGVTLTEVDYTGEGRGDEDGHGTHCAGTIFGRPVGGMRIGVASGVTEAFVGKVVGKQGAGTTTLLKAIRDASDAGCQIVSMSLGFDFPRAAARLIEDYGLPPDLATALALADYRANVRLFDRLGELMQAQTWTERRELLLFAASGNESRREVNPDYEMPASPPSEAVGFTSVGALDRGRDGKLTVAPFSNTGCDVCAPGVGILSAKAGTTDELWAMSGTSMATPHAAGIAALYLEREAAQPARTSVLRGRGGVLYRILGAASRQGLAPGFTNEQVGLGVILAPTS